MKCLIKHLAVIFTAHFASLFFYYNFRIETKSAVSAVHFLLQSVEAALPNRKKNVAVTEFKHAMVSHKRRSKAQLVEKGQMIYNNNKWLYVI